MKKIVLIACGAGKRTCRSKACELYTGSLFTKSLQYAQSLTSDKNIYILSAKHHLLALNTMVKPYNKTLNNMKKEDRKAWAGKVLQQLRKRANLDKDKFVFLAGKKYRQFLICRIKHHCIPLEGLRIGKQLQRLGELNKGEYEMSRSCCMLHKKFTRLSRFCLDKFCGNDADLEKVPTNGIYIVFEKGEKAHSVERIVRIGTHTGDGNLQKRIKEHLCTPKKDRSIFRKHIGRCILTKRNDKFLEHWDRDLTTKAVREKWAEKIEANKQRQEEVEEEVSAYIKENLTFAVIPLSEKGDRLYYESRLLSTIAKCNECESSKGWLGRHHPKREIIRKTGLWNVQGLKKCPLSPEQVEELFAKARI